ncbi:MAG: septum formation protein Maf [Chlorobi bacterium]|nr:septum formation protein Maf [Chlorobiota bacterium]
MTGKFLKQWKDKEVILASASPRRKALMKGLDIPFRVVIPENIPELYPETLSVEDIPLFLARQKAEAHRSLVKTLSVLLTADTIVVQNGVVIQKPSDRRDAEMILQKLSGRMHTVLTGVCLRSPEKERCFTAITKVYFSTLSGYEIAYYLDTYKPYDKAGAYGIQEWIGYVGIDRIEGSFFNVMGLPVHQVYHYLKEF